MIVEWYIFSRWCFSGDCILLILLDFNSLLSATSSIVKEFSIFILNLAILTLKSSKAPSVQFPGLYKIPCIPHVFSSAQLYVCMFIPCMNSSRNMWMCIYTRSFHSMLTKSNSDGLCCSFCSFLLHCSLIILHFSFYLFTSWVLQILIIITIVTNETCSCHLEKFPEKYLHNWNEYYRLLSYFWKCHHAFFLTIYSNTDLFGAWGCHFKIVCISL